MRTALLLLATLSFTFNATLALACIPKPNSFSARSCSEVKRTRSDATAAQVCFGRVATREVVSFDFISIKLKNSTLIYRVLGEKTITQKADGTIVSEMSVVAYGTVQSDGTIKVLATSRELKVHKLSVSRNDILPGSDTVKGKVGNITIDASNFLRVPVARGC